MKNLILFLLIALNIKTVQQRKRCVWKNTCIALTVWRGSHNASIRIYFYLISCILTTLPSPLPSTKYNNNNNYKSVFRRKEKQEMKHTHTQCEWTYLWKKEMITNVSLMVKFVPYKGQTSAFNRINALRRLTWRWFSHIFPIYFIRPFFVFKLK